MKSNSDTIAATRAVAKPPDLFTSGTSARFTLDGSDELERHLERACQQVLAGVKTVIPLHRLEAVLLGGGYGRGEGGVLRTEGVDQPYNDLEFYVFIRGNNWLNEHRYRQAFHRLGEQLAPLAGVELDFKIISLAKFRRSPPSMFYFDLVKGHHWLWGDERLLTGCQHQGEARSIPWSEAIRLMMNRCSGLLFARATLQQKQLSDADADFVSRNLAKAQLALGDAVLTVFGQYHWSCRQRQDWLRRLAGVEKLPWLPEVLCHHAAGVAFKLHPQRGAGSTRLLQAQHEDVTRLARQLWLWLESRRLGRPFSSPREYALCQINKFPDTDPSRNRLVNARVFGPAALFQKHASRHPRERLLHALALLLWEPFESDPELTRCLQRELRAPPGAPDDLFGAYRALWERLK